MRQSTDYERCIVRCPICKEFVNTSYPQYLELLKFLREEIFFIRPHFYNRQAHGKSAKWYWYSVPNDVFTISEHHNHCIFITRLEKLLKKKFPDFYDKISVTVNSYEPFAHQKSVIVKFKYHKRHEGFF